MRFGLGEKSTSFLLPRGNDRQTSKLFDKTPTAALNDLPEWIESALCTISNSFYEQNRAGVVITFAFSTVKALDPHNACSILNHNDKFKVMINILENKLEPSLLRDLVDMRRGMEHRR